MFNEKWMKKTSKDFTLDFFLFLSKNFFPKFELVNSGCGLSAGVYGIQQMVPCPRTLESFPMGLDNL